MKVKVEQLLGRPQATKKNNGSGVLKFLAQYSDGSRGVHLMYAGNIADLQAVKAGSEVEVQFQELVFLQEDQKPARQAV